MSTTVLKSNQVTFVDTTDARKLEVYLASNLPTVQIYNVNNGNYSPDWSVGENLKLTASVFLDSRAITISSVKWYKQIGTNIKSQLSNTSASLTISTNEMSGDVSMITYHCEVEYQGLTSTSQIIFTRTDTGRDGINGKDAKVVAQYSASKDGPWETILETDVHTWIRFSYDNGVNWDKPIKIAGKDGTSVSINGTAYYDRTLTDADIGKTIDSLKDINNNVINTENLQTGAGYIVDGYLCVYSQSDGKFICSGAIQGPQGADGKSSFFFVRYAEDENGKNMDENPNTNTKWIGTYVSQENKVPDANQFTWRKFVGEDGKDAKAIVLNGSSQIFKVNGTATAPETITVTAQAINTTITAWTYSVDGGKTFTSTRPSGVVISGNIITITGSTLSSDSVVIKATDGTYSDTYTVYKISNGAMGASASMAFLTNENISFSANASGQIKATTFETSVVAYTGTQKVTPVIGTLTGLPTGMTLSSSTTSSNEIVLSFSIADNATFGTTTNTNGTIIIPVTSPVSTNLKLNWSKINAGAKGVDGVGINSITITYGQSDSPSTQPTSWNKDIPNVPEGQYLWTRTITDYTDSAKEDTVAFTYAKQGAKGETGTDGTSVTVSSIQYQEGGSPTNAPIGTWQGSVVSVAEGNYLWTKTTFSDGKIAYGVAKQGVKGDKGDKGNTGDKGADAYTILLTNESHVFAGNVSSAVASNATTQVLAYKGTASQSVTIVSVNGVAASTASTATGITGLTFACSSLSGTSPTITFTCTTSFVSANGSIPIVLSVGGVSITKMFTYSIAFKGSTGATGGTGPQGASSTSYWLISSANVVQKNASGTVVLTPSTLTFTGKSQTGANAPIDYGCRWIIAYSTDGFTYTDVYTSTANETTKTFTVDSTYKTIRVRMYLAGGVTTLLDEQIIPVISDGAIGTPGTDAVIFQVYSSNGYALSTNTPIITLQTFAYAGDIEITAGATYQWYRYSDADWETISGATNSYFSVSRDNVSFSTSYMCKMQFNETEYVGVVTIDDKNDTNKVFTTKPSNYVAGDIWIVGADYAPVGVEVGTLLKAEHTNTTYEDTDWVTSLKYDEKIDEIQKNIETYNQYFSFDSTEGLKISAKDDNGTPSQFSTSLTNERLSFNYGDEAVAYINGTKMNIKEAEIESPLTVTGKYSGSTMLQAPVINIGNFSIIVESNGSLSIVANT